MWGTSCGGSSQVTAFLGVCVCAKSRWGANLLPARLSPKATDDLGEFLRRVAPSPCELDKLPRLVDHSAPIGCPGDGDAPAAPELEKALIPESPEGTQDGVLIDAGDRSQVLRRR